MVLFSFFRVFTNLSTGRGKLPLVFRCIRYAPGIGSPGRQEPGPGTQIAPDFFCIQRHEYHTTYVPVPAHANRLLRNQDRERFSFVGGERPPRMGRNIYNRRCQPADRGFSHSPKPQRGVTKRWELRPVGAKQGQGESRIRRLTPPVIDILSLRDRFSPHIDTLFPPPNSKRSRLEFTLSRHCRTQKMQSVDKFNVEVGCRPPGGNVGDTYRHADSGAGTATQTYSEWSAAMYFHGARNRPAGGCLLQLPKKCATLCTVDRHKAPTLIEKQP